MNDKKNNIGGKLQKNITNKRLRTESLQKKYFWQNKRNRKRNRYRILCKEGKKLKEYKVNDKLKAK